MRPPAKPGRLPIAGVAVAALAVALAGCSQGTAAKGTAATGTAAGGTPPGGTLAGQPAPSWVTAWGASQVVGGAVIQGLDCPSGAGLAHQTVRNVVFLSAGGDEVRVQLSNAFGARVITIAHATVAQATSGSSAAAVPGSVRDLAFGGQPAATIPRGGTVLSDPVHLRVAALSDLLVSAYVPGTTGPVTNHPFAGQDNYLATGDRTGMTPLTVAGGWQARRVVQGVQGPPQAVQPGRGRA
jgi:hypothetical protein